MDKDTRDTREREREREKERDSKAIMITTKVTLSSVECRNLSPQASAKNK